MSAVLFRKRMTPNPASTDRPIVAFHDAGPHNITIVRTRQRPDAVEGFLNQPYREAQTLGKPSQERHVEADQLTGRILVANRSKSSVGTNSQLPGI